MNRLILIGNGFDLAHGFNTKYCNFLDYIWKNFNKKGLFEKVFTINDGHFSSVEVNNYKEFKDYCSHYKRNKFKFIYKTGNRLFDINYIFEDKHEELIFSIKNAFLEHITLQNAITWVDIENSYYNTLISLLQKENMFSGINSIKQLNEDFEIIKQLLQKYLIEEVERKYNIYGHYINDTEIFRLFGYEHKDLNKIKSHKYYLEFDKSDHKSLQEFDNKFHPYQMHKQELACFENMFLDFNYTSTVSEYVKALNKANYKVYGDNYHIKIHGDVFDNSGENPINFGFGDEMDEKYKMIENENDNNYLQNIKSFMYLNNSNYRKLLNWINEKEFQVFVMGHSCGLSDRTMLNTIFEHHNCRSIKVFYHAYDGKDNFRDTIQNISRCFNKKALMREKVVDKGLSEPLPQEVRFPQRKSTS